MQAVAWHMTGLDPKDQSMTATERAAATGATPLAAFIALYDVLVGRTPP